MSRSIGMHKIYVETYKGQPESKLMCECTAINGNWHHKSNKYEKIPCKSCPMIGHEIRGQLSCSLMKFMSCTHEYQCDY